MDRTAEPALLIQALRATVTRLESAAGQVLVPELSQPPTPGAWSLNEILWHIRAQSDVYGEHITRILNEENPAWRHVSPRARMKKVRYDLMPFAESFAAFSAQRSELLSRLDRAPADAWQRFAIVRVEKGESQLSLRERIWGMANHEGIHCHEFEQLAAAIRRS